MATPSGCSERHCTEMDVNFDGSVKRNHSTTPITTTIDGRTAKITIEAAENVDLDGTVEFAGPGPVIPTLVDDGAGCDGASAGAHRCYFCVVPGDGAAAPHPGSSPP